MARDSCPDYSYSVDETRRRGATDGSTAGDADAAVDIDALRQLRGLTGETGRDLAGELVELFGTNTAEVLARLRELAGAPLAAAPEAERLAHALKSSSASVGATGMAELARAAEDLVGQRRLSEVAALADRMVEALGPVLARLREARLLVMREP